MEDIVMADATSLLASNQSALENDPLLTKLERPEQLSTRQKLLAILNEVEVIFDAFLTLIASQRSFASDPSISVFLPQPPTAEGNELEFAVFEQSIHEIISLLSERQQDFTKLVIDAVRESEIEMTVVSLVEEADRLKDQVMALQSRLKEAEQVLASALHMAKHKTESIKAADDAQLNLDDIIRYAHRISVGNSAAAPSNWIVGDPRRPYPTEVEMRAGLLARLSQDIPPPPSQILALPTENLTNVSQKFLSSNAGPFTMSPQPASQGPVDSPKTPMTSNIPRDVSDVETMSSGDSSSSSSSEEE